MVLQNSGPIKLSDLAAQYGQTAAAGQNLKISEYRRGGAYGVLAAVGANAAAPNVPSNNYNIKMSDFYGAYKIKTPVLNTIPTLTGTNTSANVTFSMASYLVSSSNYGTVTWTMTGTPTGVTINSSTGVITSTAGTRVNNSITVTATGPGAIPVSKTFTMMTTTKIIPWFTGVNNAFVYAVIPGGQFYTEKLAVTFTKLYGMYFLNDVQQFTIEWTFTDGTNSFDSFFNKANTTNYGATYTFKVFNASASSAAVKSAYDSAVSASNQTYGIGALDSNGDILLRGNLRISETANIYKDGTAISTGLNNNGQLGIGSTLTTSNFSIVAGVSNAIAVDAGYTHAMYMTSNGIVVSAGSDANGQLGRGASSANVVINANIVPMLMPDGSNVYARAISAGGYHSAVFLNNGSAYLCGKNDQGQCGASPTIVPHANSLGIISTLSNVVDVACGHEHTLFTRYDGQVLGFGRNDRGQLGQGNKTSPVTSVVQVLAGGGAGSSNGLSVEIAAGFNHSAYIKNDNTIFVFGANDKGQLGLGQTTTDLWDMRATISHVEGTIRSSLMAVGKNASRQIGDNTAIDRYSPVDVGVGSFGSVIISSAKSVTHSAIALQSGEVWCWGNNTYGQCGKNTAGAVVSVPTKVVSITNAVEVACGNGFTFVRNADDTVMAFGNNIAAGTSHAASIDGSAFTTETETVSNLFVNFTGQHRCFVDALAPARLRDHEGLVVVTDKNAYASGLLRGRRTMTINQALPLVSLSKVPKDPRAFGVISLTQDHPAGPSAAISGTELLRIAEQGDVRVQINSIGEGCIWVCDETGSTIHAGDYVTTSSLSGYASLQVLDDGDVPDGTLRNYTVAKLTMDCDFSQPLVDVEEVQKDEYGNVVFDADGSLVYTIVTTTQGPSVVDLVTGEKCTKEPLETPIPVTEPSYEMRWMTTEIDASSGVSITTLISKEDYEKRGIIQFGEGGTGLFNPVAGTLGVVAGGTEMVRVSDTTVSLMGDLVVSSNIVPMRNATQYPGTSTMHFKEAWIDELHISSNTLYIGDTPVLCADNDAVSIRADPGQGITLTTTGDGETSLVSTKGVNVVSEGGVTMRVSGPLGRVNIQSSGAGGTVNLGA
eukprot:gene27803-biopygen5218